MGLESFDSDQHKLYSRLLNWLDLKKEPRIAFAMTQADRRKFVPPDYKDDPFSMAGIVSLGENSTMSMLSVVADILRLAQIQPGLFIFDAGSGSGFQAAVEAELTGDSGQVITAEIDPIVSDMAQVNLQSYSQVQVVTGDAGQIMREYGPFDRIIFSMGVAKNKLNLVIDNLKPDGICVAPVSISKNRPISCRLEAHSQTKKIAEMYSLYEFIPAQGILGWSA